MPSHDSPVPPLPTHRHLTTESLVKVFWSRTKVSQSTGKTKVTFQGGLPRVAPCLMPALSLAQV